MGKPKQPTKKENTNKKGDNKYTNEEVKEEQIGPWGDDVGRQSEEVNFGTDKNRDGYRPIGTPTNTPRVMLEDIKGKSTGRCSMPNIRAGENVNAGRRFSAEDMTEFVKALTEGGAFGRGSKEEKDEGKIFLGNSTPSPPKLKEEIYPDKKLL